MKRLKKNIFVGSVSFTVVVLALIRCACPGVLDSRRGDSVTDSLLLVAPDSVVDAQLLENQEITEQSEKNRTWRHGADGLLPLSQKSVSFVDSVGKDLKHKIYSVPSFRRTFPDLQDVHIVAARKWGVSPVRDRKEAEQRKHELVYIGSNPYYVIDPGMNRSIPYLVPRASELLQRISRNFLDSLAIKDMPLHLVIVTSVLRTDEDVHKLRRHNSNASAESCHRFGTTFDIAYNRYVTVQHPDSSFCRPVRNDSLKWVLSEVLRDLRQEELCLVKYEVRQGCFHITVR